MCFYNDTVRMQRQFCRGICLAFPQRIRSRLKLTPHIPLRMGCGHSGNMPMRACVGVGVSDNSWINQRSREVFNSQLFIAICSPRRWEEVLALGLAWCKTNSFLCIYATQIVLEAGYACRCQTVMTLLPASAADSHDGCVHAERKRRWGGDLFGFVRFRLQWHAVHF